MKKLCLLLAGVFVLTACEKEPNTAPVQDDPTIEQCTETVVDYRVSKSTAINRAIKAVEGLKGRAESRAEALRVAKAEVVGSRVASRSGYAADTLFYLINFDDNQGFALVAADERNTDVYMMAEEGSLDLETLDPESPVSYFMNQAEEYATYERGVIRPVIPELDTTNMTYFDDTKYYNGELYLCHTEEEEVIQDALLTTKWHQNYPYNKNCLYNGVRVDAGCAAIAVAQIMAYHRHPSTYNWDAMLRYNMIDISETDAVEAVASLVYNVGSTIEIDYEGDGNTGATIDTVHLRLPNLGYLRNSVTNYSFDTVVSSVLAERPVYIRGDEVNSYSLAHAWIIDGVQYSERTEYLYDIQTRVLTYTLVTRDNQYVHNNWGREYENAWTLSGVFEFYGYRYSNNNKIISNIRPM